MGIRETIKDVAHKTGATIDDVAAGLVPYWGHARKIARRKVSARFDGSSRRNRLKLWRGMTRGPNSEIDVAVKTLRDRSRDLCANHWAGSRAKTVVKNHVVGAGITPTPRGSGTENIAAILEDLTHPTYTGFDVRGSKSLFAIYALAVGTMFQDGDAFVVAHFRSAAEMRQMGLDVPLQLRVLESDHLDTLKTGPLEGGHYVTRGIEFDRYDRPVAYWLYPEHPKDLVWSHNISSVRVPAENVAHLFDEMRPGQVSGIPWPSSVMVKMRDSADYEDAHLVRQKIAALFSMFIHQPDGLYMENDGSDGDLLPEKMEPGTVEYLRPGEDVTFAAPPGVEGFRDFSEITARQIAAGCDLTYEALTTDYSQVNFTSARMGWLEMAKSVERWQKTIVLPKLCGKVEMWLRMAVASMGIDPGGRRWKHVPPRPEMIDPVRETSAMKERVRSGFSSRREEVARRGGNVEEVDREIAEDNERAEELGIVLDSNPGQTTGAGLTPQIVTEEQRTENQEEG